MTISYKRHRFPPQVIAHAVWLYFRFPLRLRFVQDMLLVRGIVVSCETIRRWAVNKRQSAIPARKRTSDWIFENNIIFLGVPAGAEQDPVSNRRFGNKSKVYIGLVRGPDSMLTHIRANFARLLTNVVWAGRILSGVFDTSGGGHLSVGAGGPRTMKMGTIPTP